MKAKPKDEVRARVQGREAALEQARACVKDAWAITAKTRQELRRELEELGISVEEIQDLRDGLPPANPLTTTGASVASVDQTLANMAEAKRRA